MNDPVLIAAVTTAVVALLGFLARKLDGEKQPERPAPTPTAKAPQWKVEVVSEEVATRGNDADRDPMWDLGSRMHRRVWLAGAALTPTEEYDERLTDYVLVQITRRVQKLSDYGRNLTTHTDRLRIGAVAIADPAFDTRIAELRGYAEERAQTLNALVEP